MYKGSATFQDMQEKSDLAWHLSSHWRQFFGKFLLKHFMSNFLLDINQNIIKNHVAWNKTFQERNKKSFLWELLGIFLSKKKNIVWEFWIIHILWFFTLFQEIAILKIY